MMRACNLLLNKLDHLKFRYTLWKYVEPADNLIDIGCGETKQQFVTARRTLGIDPVCPKDIKHIDSFVQGDWSTALEWMDKMLFDTVLLADVIEHLNYPEAKRLLEETENQFVKQIVVFTPYGMLYQEDGEYNTHRSGWLPSDFGKDWQVFVFPHFHWCDFKGNEYTEPKGAILAIYTKPR